MSDFITVAELRIEAERLCDENEHLQAENAKLREELADAPKCETCEAMLDCDECLRADGSHKERRRLSAENAKLRELLAEDNEELAKMRRAIDYLYSFAKTCGVNAEDMHELEVEVRDE